MDGSNAKGRPRTFMNDDVLDAMADHSETVLTLGEIAEEMDRSKGAVNPRLKELADNGKIERKKVGSRAVVYWISPESTLVDPIEV